MPVGGRKRRAGVPILTTLGQTVGRTTLARVPFPGAGTVPAESVARMTESSSNRSLTLHLSFHYGHRSQFLRSPRRVRRSGRRGGAAAHRLGLDDRARWREPRATASRSSVPRDRPTVSRSLARDLESDGVV